VLIPLVTELVRVKDRSEVFQVVQLNLSEHTVDLVSLETDIVEYGVHWNMLEALEKRPGKDDRQSYPWRVL
jgi:hypothetical protein